MMKEFITNAQDLHEHLCSINGMSAFHKRRCLSDGPIVSTKVRKQYLCSEYQGRIIMSGESMRVCFDSFGGGCWKVRIERLNGKTFLGSQDE
jgi:hypothetical protein